MFLERTEGYLAFSPKDEASRKMARVIVEVLRAQDIEPTLSTDLDTGSPPEDAHSAIRRAAVMVADLTGASPNVLFEVGLGLGLGKPVLLMSQGSSADVPFDLRRYQIARYRPDDTDTVRRYAELWLRDVLVRHRGNAA